MKGVEWAPLLLGIPENNKDTTTVLLNIIDLLIWRICHELSICFLSFCFVLPLWSEVTDGRARKHKNVKAERVAWATWRGRSRSVQSHSRGHNSIVRQPWWRQRDGARGWTERVRGRGEESGWRHERKESDYHAVKGEGRMTLIWPDLNDRSVRNKVLGSSVPDLARERRVCAREGSRRIGHAWSEMVPNRPEAGTE